MIKCSNNYLSFNSTATDKFFGNIGHYLCLSWALYQCPRHCYFNLLL